jgi:orotate phosphoribosyltransferase
MSTQTLEKSTNSAIDTTYHQELFERIQTLSFKTGNFVLASGKASSFYLDCRKTTLDGRGSFLIGRLCYDILSELNIDAVGGMSMGADPIVSSITYRSADVGSPIQGFLVRKEAKGHGTGKQVEGHLEPWMRVALVEDVVTTGGSTLKAIKAVERACPGIQIVKILALVDREEGAQEAFAKRSIPFERLYSVQSFLT